MKKFIDAVQQRRTGISSSESAASSHDDDWADGYYFISFHHSAANLFRAVPDMNLNTNNCRIKRKTKH